MTFLTLTRPTFLRRFEGVWPTLMSWRDCAPPPDAAQEDTRASRDFILESLGRNPDAFQSELDIQNMARLYRCKF